MDESTAAPLSSLPRYLSSAVVDASARRLALVGVGVAGGHLVRSWQAAADGVVSSVWALTAPAVTAPVRAEFDAELASAVIGWRLMLAGPDAAVSELSARALEAGAEPSEIRTVLTTPALAAVYCPHCRSVSTTAGGPGSELRCCGCGRPLTVRPHFSVRRGAYLGVASVPAGR